MSIARPHSITASLSKLAVVLASLICFVSCDDNATSPGEQDIATFSKQLQGTWTLDKVTVRPDEPGSVVIAPVREFACDKLSKVFSAKDVVNKYSISYSNKTLSVKKHYTCRLAPEELNWRITPGDVSGESINWMTGKNFMIKEIREAALTAEYKLLFFNLDNCGPDGKPASASTRNKLWLEVSFDTKEEATFRLEFSKNN